VSTGGAHQRPADHLASRPPLPKGLSSVRSCPSQLDGEADSKVSRCPPFLRRRLFENNCVFFLVKREQLTGIAERRLRSPAHGMQGQ